MTDGLAAVEYLLASGGNAVLGTNLDFTDRRLRRSGLAKEPSFVLPSGYKPFSIGGLGNFPYYWRDPGSFSFNETTYGWITAALKAGCMPVQLDEVFTNRFLSAFGRISYSLSTKEGSDLRGASEDALDKQSALLEVWQSAFDTFPPSDAIGSRPIDLIMIQITQTWASPATDLNALLHATDFNKVLNQIPPAGQPILPALKAYLAQISSTVPLLNKVSRNIGLLRKALSALHAPGPENGAMKTNRERYVPTYSCSPSPTDIRNALLSESGERNVRLKFGVASRAKDGVFDVDVDSVRGPTRVRMPATQLLKLDAQGSRGIAKPIFLDDAHTITADFDGSLDFARAFFHRIAKELVLDRACKGGVEKWPA